MTNNVFSFVELKRDDGDTWRYHNFFFLKRGVRKGNDLDTMSWSRKTQAAGAAGRSMEGMGRGAYIGRCRCKSEQS
jgi:hypothetical protein